VLPEVAFPEVEFRIIGVGAGGVAIAGVGAWCVPVGGVGVTDRVGGPPAAKTDSWKIIVAVTATKYSPYLRAHKLNRFSICRDFSNYFPIFVKIPYYLFISCYTCYL